MAAKKKTKIVTKTASKTIEIDLDSKAYTAMRDKALQKLKYVRPFEMERHEELEQDLLQLGYFEASEYAAEMAPALNSWRPSANLLRAFKWEETEMGVQFWADIYVTMVCANKLPKDISFKSETKEEFVKSFKFDYDIEFKNR